VKGSVTTARDAMTIGSAPTLSLQIGSGGGPGGPGGPGGGGGGGGGPGGPGSPQFSSALPSQLSSTPLPQASGGGSFGLHDAVSGGPHVWLEHSEAVKESR
jgi:hypothetical protein